MLTITNGLFHILWYTSWCMPRFSACLTDNNGFVMLFRFKVSVEDTSPYEPAETSL